MTTTEKKCALFAAEVHPASSGLHPYPRAEFQLPTLIGRSVGPCIQCSDVLTKSQCRQLDVVKLATG